VDFRPVAPATVWVPSCSRPILIATGFCRGGVQGETGVVPSPAGSRAGAAANDLAAALAPNYPGRCRPG
jgi:hypothetical protein